MNPKDRIGQHKIPLSLWPPAATVYGALGLADGAAKYGRNNWRKDGVIASIYVDALLRHVFAWFEGEEYDTESGVPHLGHALANLAILIDAQLCGKLVDDRNADGAYTTKWLAEMTGKLPKQREQENNDESG